MSNVFVQFGIGFPLLMAFLLWVGRVRKVVAVPCPVCDGPLPTLEGEFCDRCKWETEADRVALGDRLRARGVEPTKQALAAYKVAVAIADEIAEKQAQAEWEREKQDRDNERGGV